MNLQEQIDEAWESYCGDAELNPNIFPDKQEGFEEGYRACSRQLLLGTFEWIGMDNSSPPQLWVWAGDHDESAIPVRRIYLPHPSEIFGEEGA